MLFILSIVSYHTNGFLSQIKYKNQKLNTYNNVNNIKKMAIKASSDSVIIEAIKNAKPGKSFMKCRAIGVGSCAGGQIMENDDFVSLVDTSDKWISKRTGIRRRHLMESCGSLRELSSNAASEALKNSNIDPNDVDLVIVATSSPDDIFGDAASVASAIGAKNSAAFDMTAACSGFLYGLITASQFLHAGTYKKIVVVGADALSRFLDWDDRSTCILFGDGAGAVVLEATDSIEDAGILGFALSSNGEGHCNLNCNFNSNFVSLDNDAKTVVDKGSYGKIFMNGAEVYKFAVNEVPNIVSTALNNAGIKADDVDWLLLHQANYRIMEHASEVLGIPMSKVIVNLDEYGNTSAGSIPLALSEAVKDGRVKKGDIIAVAGFGAGLNWGSCVMRWG